MEDGGDGADFDYGHGDHDGHDGTHDAGHGHEADGVGMEMHGCDDGFDFNGNGLEGYNEHGFATDFHGYGPEFHDGNHPGEPSGPTKQFLHYNRLAYGVGNGTVYTGPHGAVDNNPLKHRAYVIALAAARKHGAPELLWHKRGHIHQVLVPGSSHLACPELPPRNILMPGMARDTSCIEVVYFYHGPNLRTQQYFREQAKRIGLQDVSRILTEKAPVDESYPYLTDNTPFDSAANRTEMPGGWFPGAKGPTRTWRERWQVPPGFFERKTFEPWRTYLEVFGAEWNYGGFGYETRLNITIWSVPFLEKRAWTYRWDQITKHREAAECLAHTMQTYLRSTSPSQADLDLLKILTAPRRPKKPTPPEPPVPPPTGSICDQYDDEE